MVIEEVRGAQSIEMRTRCDKCGHIEDAVPVPRLAYLREKNARLAAQMAEMMTYSQERDIREALIYEALNAAKALTETKGIETCSGPASEAFRILFEKLSAVEDYHAGIAERATEHLEDTRERTEREEAPAEAVTG